MRQVVEDIYRVALTFQETVDGIFLQRRASISWDTVSQIETRKRTGRVAPSVPHRFLNRDALTADGEGRLGCLLVIRKVICLVNHALHIECEVVVISVPRFIFTGMLLAATSVQARPPLYIREGNSTYGKVLMTVDGNKVHQGNSSYGPVLFTIDGNKIREGNSSYGTIIATVENGKVIAGNSNYGKVVANVGEGQIREGNSSYGKVIANTDGGQMSGAAAASLLLMR